MPYVPSVYWLAVVLISIVGTLFTDNLVDNLGVPLQATTVGFAHLPRGHLPRCGGVPSAHCRSTPSPRPRREAFYWLAILFTFALGTAAGDLLAEGLSIGYLASALLFAACIGLVAVAHYCSGWGPCLASGSPTS